MHIVSSALLFILALVAIWISAGYLVEIVGRLARRFHRSSFALSFFILGLLTSISEISVAINARIENVPQVSAGNLIGASLVIVLLIIPLLAMFGKGIKLTHSFSPGSILLAAITIVLPALVILDGRLTILESVGLLVFYGALLITIEQPAAKAIHPTSMLHSAAQRQPARIEDTVYDVCKLLLGAIVIFIAAHVLVHGSLFFSTLLKIPSSFIGLLVLSIGTNVPELVIAARAIIKKHNEIAFGDYMGSAAMNTLIFGLLGLANGGFALERTEFFASFIVLAAGLLLFIIFCSSKRVISRAEGWGLFCIYLIYLLWQFGTLTRVMGA